MVHRRVYINLGTFAVLFALLGLWAVTNVVRPSFLRDSYRVDAEFSEASGLRPGVEVTLLGVRIGQVAQVTAAPGRADVALDIDHGVSLPDGSGAAVRRRSAVGEPYVAINPPAGWTQGGPTMTTHGYRIPVSATSTPVAYGQLFTSAQALLHAVDPADVATISHELATALRGRGDELATLITNGSDVASTLASGQAELRELGQGITALTSTLADKSATIAKSTQDLSTIVQVVSSNADQLGDLLDNAPVVSRQIDAILNASYAQLVCGADAAAAISSVLGNDTTVTHITELLRAAETASVVIPKAVYNGPDGRYLSGTFGLAVGHPDAYPLFPTFSAPPALPTCAGPSPVISPVPADDAPAMSQATGADSTRAAPGTSRSEAAAQSTPPSAARRASNRTSPAIAALLLCLVVVVGLALTVRSRRAAARRAGSPDQPTGATRT